MDASIKKSVLQELRKEMLKGAASRFPKKEVDKEEKAEKPGIMIRLMQLEGKK